MFNISFNTHICTSIYTCIPVPSLAEHGNICHCLSLIACKFKPCVISTTDNALSKSF